MFLDYDFVNHYTYLQIIFSKLLRLWASQHSATLSWPLACHWFQSATKAIVNRHKPLSSMNQYTIYYK